jgi:pimeloyl-ACP methyl ester carboxylesterase
MDNLPACCAPGATFKEEMIAVDENVSLRLITFTSATKTDNLPVVFVAGWLSKIFAWERVIKEMTKDFDVYYIETREKTSSQVTGKVDYSAEVIGKDIIAIISYLKLKTKNFILFGSSLGATAILDCCRFLHKAPLCLVLVAPNADFRVPKWGMPIIRVFPPRLYLMVKPIVKWYLKTFRLDVKTDYAQYQKYCSNLDAADPWKLKKAAIQLLKYEVWGLLGEIEHPTLIIGASKDVLHEPENLPKIASMMQHATYLDLGTNANTHSAEMVEEIRKYLEKLNISDK